MAACRIRDSRCHGGRLPGVQKLYLEFRNAEFNVLVDQARAERFAEHLQRYPGSVLLVGGSAEGRLPYPHAHRCSQSDAVGNAPMR